MKPRYWEPGGLPHHHHHIPWGDVMRSSVSLKFEFPIGLLPIASMSETEAVLNAMGTVRKGRQSSIRVEEN